MNKLREARKKRGLTAEQAANCIGLKPPYLSQIESGFRTINFHRAKQLADLYGVKIEEIFEPIRFQPRFVGEAQKK